MRLETEGGTGINNKLECSGSSREQYPAMTDDDFRHIEHFLNIFSPNQQSSLSFSNLTIDEAFLGPLADAMTNRHANNIVSLKMDIRCRAKEATDLIEQLDRKLKLDVKAKIIPLESDPETVTLVFDCSPRSLLSTVKNPLAALFAKRPSATALPTPARSPELTSLGTAGAEKTAPQLPEKTSRLSQLFVTQGKKKAAARPATLASQEMINLAETQLDQPTEASPLLGPKKPA